MKGQLFGLVAVLVLVGGVWAGDAKPIPVPAEEVTPHGDRVGEIKKLLPEWSKFCEKYQGKQVEFAGVVEWVNVKNGEVNLLVRWADPLCFEIRKARIFCVVTPSDQDAFQLLDRIHESRFKFGGTVTGRFDFNPRTKALVIRDAKLNLQRLEK